MASSTATRRTPPSMWENYDLSRANGFGAEVKRRIMLGTYALSEGYADAYYWQAQKVRTVIEAEFDRVFRIATLLCGPGLSHRRL